MNNRIVQGILRMRKDAAQRFEQEAQPGSWKLRPLRNTALVLVGSGMALAMAAGLLALLASGEEQWVGLLLAPFAALMLATAMLLFVIDRWLKRRREAAFAGRAPMRAQMLLAAEQLADSLHGRVERNTILCSHGFLHNHWPDRAPQWLRSSTEAHFEDRIIVAGTVDGMPCLIGMVDFQELNQVWWMQGRSPALAILVSRPGTIPSCATERSSEAWLASVGLTPRSNEAGVWAAKNPAQDIVTQAQTLVGAVKALASIARSRGPVATEHDPSPPADRLVDMRDPGLVATRFCEYLCQRDMVSAWELADVRLGAELEADILPSDLQRLLDRRGLWPQRVQPASTTRVGKAFEKVIRFALHDGSTADIGVQLYLCDGIWRVCALTLQQGNDDTRLIGAQLLFRSTD